MSAVGAAAPSPAAFWAGLLRGRPLPPGSRRGWRSASASARSSGRGSPRPADAVGPGALERAGSWRPDPAAVAAVAAPRTNGGGSAGRRARARPLGVVALGAGWAGCRTPGVDGSSSRGSRPSA